MYLCEDIVEFIMSFLIFEKKEHNLEFPPEEEEEHWIYTSYV